MFCYSNGVNGLHTSLVLLKCLDFTWVMKVRFLGCSFILVALQLIHWASQWPEVKNNNSSKVVFRYSAVPYWIQCLWQSTHIWLSSNTKTTFFFFSCRWPIVIRTTLISPKASPFLFCTNQNKLCQELWKILYS